MSHPLPSPLTDAPLVDDWIRFEGGRHIRLLTGRVELGQGNMTALLQMAADELDVDPQSVSITGADTAQTPNEGFTTSSLSIAVGGISLRLAASAARHILLRKAAELLQTTPEELSITDGSVLRGGVNTDLDLWKLAETVPLNVVIADHAEPKSPADRGVAGRSLARIDLESRITGHPFAHDIRMEGMVYGRAVHAPSLHSKLVSLDIKAIEQRPGVLSVVQDGSFVGIIASSEYAVITAASRASELAEWSKSPSTPDDPVSEIKHSREAAEVVHETGAPDTATGKCFEMTISRHYLSHGSIGPSSATALWEDGHLTIWSHTQGVYPLRAALDQVFGIGVNNITVTHSPGSGCYGHNGADDVALDAALMARSLPGRPVHVVWSRANEFQCAPLGPAMATTARAWLDPDDRIQTMEVMVNSTPHGNRPGRNGAPNLRAAAYLENSFPFPRSADIPLAMGGGADRNAIPLYAIPNLRISKRLVHELPYRTSSMRGLGAHANIYAIETLMDAIAHEQGEDPIAFRLRHLEDERARAVIKQVASSAADIVNDTASESAGWGIGFGRYKNTAAYCAIIVRIELDESIRVTQVHACFDSGEIINPDGAINQLEGGILQSMSWTLKEALQVSGGSVATENWDDYPILKFSEVPQIDVTLIDQPELPPLGCAEAAQGPMAAAIGNALREVIGVHVKDLPLTRDAILATLHQ